MTDQTPETEPEAPAPVADPPPAPLLRAAILVSGCCKNYRASLSLRTEPGTMVSVDAVSDTAAGAENKLRGLAGAILNVPGLSLADVPVTRRAK